MHRHLALIAAICALSGTLAQAAPVLALANCCCRGAVLEPAVVDTGEPEVPACAHCQAPKSQKPSKGQKPSMGRSVGCHAPLHAVTPTCGCCILPDELPRAAVLGQPTLLPLPVIALADAVPVLPPPRASSPDRSEIVSPVHGPPLLALHCVWRI